MTTIVQIKKKKEKEHCVYVRNDLKGISSFCNVQRSHLVYIATNLLVLKITISITERKLTSSINLTFVCTHRNKYNAH
jgi:hypothetical protein